MRKYFLALLFSLSAFGSFADLVRVGLFSGSVFTAAEFVVADGNYSVRLPNGRKENLSTGSTLTFTVSGTGCSVKKNGKPLGNFSKVRMVSLLDDGTMRIRLQRPEPSLFTYGGHFEITAVKGKLRVLNLVDLESYVAAVVESEIGANSSPEFLKVQSVLCRTYCLGHLDRHAAEGFQLCDQVHCQSYKGKNRFNPIAQEAVLATRNKVLVDSGNRLIIAAYHSNCGGQTLSADSVWSMHVGYLRPVTDTFCMSGRHAAWYVSMSLRDWKNYLEEKGVIDQKTDSLLPDSLFAYDPPGRSSYYALNGKKIPLKTIRDSWKLKSTWFSIRVSGDSLLFAGCGFGHGIGLCQEGGMKMAEDGKSFAEIISFYFHDVKLADADALKLLSK